MAQLPLYNSSSAKWQISRRETNVETDQMEATVLA